MALSRQMLDTVRTYNGRGKKYVENFDSASLGKRQLVRPKIKVRYSSP
jgi:hypothetical protein